MKALAVLLVVLFSALGFTAWPAQATDPSPYRDRLVSLYAETFHSELTLDEDSATTHHLRYEGRPISITLWRGSTAKGAALAFVAPWDDSVLGVLNVDRDSFDIWQLTGRRFDAPVDANVVNFPAGMKSHVGVQDFVCGGVSAGIAGLVCGVSLLCAVGATIAGTAVCAGSHERTGRLQWHWKEDDPAGVKQSAVQYSTNYPTEGVYYQFENFLCMRNTTHPDDRRCMRPRQTGPSTVVLDPHFINYESVIKWSDGSRTTSRFDSYDWEVFPPIVWHESRYLADLFLNTIDITTKQRFVGPTGDSEWLFVDSLRATTMAFSD